MIYDKHRNEATPGARSVCGSCDGELIAKCGTIITHHWAHRAGECDSWSEPESEWHRSWKRFFRDNCGADVEVPMGEHRADVVLPNGWIVELQHGYLAAEQIREREWFYGMRLAWIYDCHWWARLQPWANTPRPSYVRRNDADLNDLHAGHGMRWIHPAKSMVVHRRSLWWHMERAQEHYGARHSSIRDLWQIKIFTLSGRTNAKIIKERDIDEIEWRYQDAAS